MGSWSMYNGLADAIWVGTKHPAEARKWVDFLATVAKHEKDGIDVSAFTSYIKSGNTFLYPITDKAPQINLIVQPTLEEFLNGNDDAETVLEDMNQQVNNQLKYAQ